MSEYTHSENTIIKRPAALPYHIESYRLDWRRVGLAGAGALLALFVGVVLLLLASALQRWSLLAAGAAVAGAVVAIAVAGTAVYLQLAEWKDHRAMLWDLHSTYIDGLQQTGGMEVQESSSITMLRADSAGDLLLVALYIHRLIESGADRPWSARNLRGPLWIGNDRVGTISKPEAEQIGRRLASAGLIVDRTEGYAGEWRPNSYNEIIQALWNRKE